MRALALILLLAAPAIAAGERQRARTRLQADDAAGALLLYNTVAHGSQDGPIIAEYAYAAAAAGLPDLALAQIDRAHQMDGRDAQVLAVGSALLAACGMKDAAAELQQPLGTWAPAKALPGCERGPLKGSFPDEMLAAVRLMEQNRPYEAAERLNRVTTRYPKEAVGWTGYGLVLEDLGAYKASAKAVGKARELTPAEDETGTLLLDGQKEALEARAPIQPVSAPKANETLKGRYLLFLGGAVTHTEDATLINANLRAGKFITNRLDVAANVGFIGGNDNGDYNGATFGVSMRGHQPIEGSLPLNAVLAGRIQYMPGPTDNTAFILSPGLSYFLETGSVDLFLDIALSGPLKNTQTLSVGYTAYFGGSR